MRSLLLLPTVSPFSRNTTSDPPSSPRTLCPCPFPLPFHRSLLLTSRRLVHTPRSLPGPTGPWCDDRCLPGSSSTTTFLRPPGNPFRLHTTPSSPRPPRDLPRQVSAPEPSHTDRTGTSTPSHPRGSLSRCLQPLSGPVPTFFLTLPPVPQVSLPSRSH